MDLNDVK